MEYAGRANKKPQVNQKPRNKCPKCLKTFQSSKQFKLHQKRHCNSDHACQFNESLGVYVCQTCSAKFLSKLNADNHSNLYKTDNFTCPQCPRQFGSLRELFCHMNSHAEDGKIPCPVCPFRTTTIKNLLEHLSCNHLTVNRCVQCDKTFNNRSNYKKHMVRHDDSMKKVCVVCLNEYRGDKALLRHQLCMHKVDVQSEAFSLFCHICRLEFRTVNLLTYHTEKAHTKNTRRPEEKKCLCDICGRGFKCSDQLKKHKVSHTEVRPFECSECGRGFKHKYALTYHKRIHTGERPHVCGYCGKGFRQWTPFKVHLRGHTGEKPYICKLCSKGFTTNQGLKLHLQGCPGVGDV